MNLGAVARMLGLLLFALSVVGLVPLAVDQAGEYPIAPWLWMNGTAIVCGLVLVLIGRQAATRDVGPREGAAITVGAWLALAAVATVGLHLAIPGSTAIECWFESMSGLTTCGATAFGEHISIETMTPGVKLWRALLQWMGGVGVIALGLVLLPMLAGGASFQLFRSEASGLALDRLTPRLADTVRFILVYNLMLNLLVAVALALCGIDWFEAVCHALAAISTGGFSTHDANVAGLANPAAEWVLIGGMLMAGVNFALVVAALRGQPRVLWRSEEVRAYLLLVLVCTAVVTQIIAWDHHGYARDTHAAIRHAAFAVVSLGTSTGFTLGFSVDPHGWAGWPAGAVAVLMLCTLGFGCTGSTVGGVKMLRLLLIAKSARRVLRQFSEPALVSPVTIDGRPVADHAILLAAAWVTCFALSLVLGTILLLLVTPIDLLSATTAAFASLTNAGPALGCFSPEHSFTAAGPAGMIILSMLMLIGRLEFIAVLVLLSRRTWRR
jgi:trk system potassium uptake protein